MEEFSTKAVLPEHLPQADPLDFTPLEPVALKIWQINLGLIFGSLLLAEALIFYFIESWRLPWLIALICGATLVYALVAGIELRYSFKWSGYALREQDLFYRSGWLRRRIRCVPIRRVQHLSVVSGWLGRRYGLASLRIYTAAQSDFSIRGIKRERAESLKAWISQQVDMEDEQESSSENTPQDDE